LFSIIVVIGKGLSSSGAIAAASTHLLHSTSHASHLHSHLSKSHSIMHASHLSKTSHVSKSTSTENIVVIIEKASEWILSTKEVPEYFIC
jgi:hypothetical protein